MKYPIQVVRSLTEILDKFVIPELKSNGLKAIRNSKKIKLPDKNEVIFRELVGGCLLSLVARHLTGEKWRPGTDHIGHDGSVFRELDGMGSIFEHTYVSVFDEKKNTPAINRIISGIKKKNQRGKEYAKGAGLFVLCDLWGELDLTKVIDPPEANNFASLWLAAKIDEEKLHYIVANLKNPGEAPTKYLVQIEQKPYGVIAKELIVNKAINESSP